MKINVICTVHVNKNKYIKKHLPSADWDQLLVVAHRDLHVARQNVRDITRYLDIYSAHLAAYAGAEDDSIPLMTVETYPRLPGGVRAALDSIQRRHPGVLYRSRFPSVSVGFRQVPACTHGWSAQNVFEKEIRRRRRLFSTKFTFQRSSGPPPVCRSYLLQSRRFGCCVSGRSHLYNHGVLRALRCNR